MSTRRTLPAFLQTILNERQLKLERARVLVRDHNYQCPQITLHQQTCDSDRDDLDEEEAEERWWEVQEPTEREVAHAWAYLVRNDALYRNAVPTTSGTA